MLPLFIAGPLIAASTMTPEQPAQPSVATPRSVSAHRLSQTCQPPKIDGQLNDECWLTAQDISGFITNQPQYGLPSAFKTTVKLVYDDNAVYVGAYLYDPQPEKISSQLSVRDGSSNSDLFAVGFDTYYDRLNAFRFQVSAAGVQTDSRLSPNTNDVSWDAVWYSKVSRRTDGWVAEIKIPLSALRFPEKEEQTWGVQFTRYVQRTNELSSWSAVNPQVDGVVNQWGALEQLQKLNPPLRLSFVPYFTAGVIKEPTFNGQKSKARKIISGGMDINWGINESFTLNTTLVPDFGQVPSDNRVLVLGPFEQQFNERRPFFTEGIDLFNKKVSLAPGQIFYSRRVGTTPGLYYSIPYLITEEEEIISNPSIAQLYNATKISGRTQKGTGVGVINAISAPTFAVIKNTTTQETRKILTDPLTNFNVLVIDQNLKNNSRVGFMNTSVIRKGGWRKANVSSLNFLIRDATNTFSHSGFCNVSQIYEPQAKPSYGFYADYLFSKISGNFRMDFEQHIISDKYDQNDLGILLHGNQTSTFIGAKYFDFVPKHKINNWDAYVSLNYTSLYKPFTYQDFTFVAGADVLFSNFWYAGVVTYVKPVRYFDYYEARTPGVKYFRPENGYLNIYAGSDNRKSFFLDVNVGFAESPVPNDPYFEASVTPNLRIKKTVTLSHNCTWNTDFKNFGFAGQYEDGGPVIGSRKLRTVVNTFSANCFITPVMNITFRARHYWSRVSYMKYFSLDEEGELFERAWNGNSSQNFNLWNIDFVYNWQFAPGSNLILTWKQNITQSDQLVFHNYLENVSSTFKSDQANVVSVKILWYLDYAQIKDWNDRRKLVKANRV